MSSPRRPLCFGTNLKMHQTPAETAAFVAGVRSEVGEVPGRDDVRLFVIPPFTSLPAAVEAARGSGLWIGAQNVHPAEEGAFTGEISTRMLQAVGVDLVLIGHAERRGLFGESDAFVNEKVRAALGKGFRVLACVGETAAEKGYGVGPETVARQLRIALHGVGSAALERVMIGYEPVWSIGAAGTPARPEDVAVTAGHLRAALRSLYPGQGDIVPILYGGSVDPSNVGAFVALDEIDGAFVGRAAWTVDGYAAVLRAALDRGGEGEGRSLSLTPSPLLSPPSPEVAMPDVVSLGVHILDVLGRPVQRIPPGQDIDLLEEIRLTVAGTAAGTSVDLAKLGVSVVAMGAIGGKGQSDGKPDAAGQFIVDTMGRYGIDTGGLRVKPDVQTSATMLPIRPNGERPALHVLGANAELSADDVDLAAIGRAKILHFGGSPLMPKLDGEPAAKVLKAAKDADVTVTMDILAVDRPDLPEKILPLLPYVDFFMPGLDEARLICRLAGEPRQDRGEVIRFFLERGARHVVFKMGDRGSVIAGEGVPGEIRLPALEVPVVDSTGCGDAYCAGFIVGLLRGWDLERCGRLGTAAAALVITGLGSDAGIVDLEQTLAFMETAAPLPMAD